MMNKKNFGMIKKNYTKIPNRIFNIVMSPGAKQLFSYMVHLPEEVNPSIKQMMSSVCVTKNSIYKYLKELEDHRFIEKISDGYCIMGANVETKWSVGKYKLLNPKDWR